MNWFYSVWFSIIRYFHLWILSKEKHSKNYLYGFVIEIYHKDINNIENKTGYLGKNLIEAKQYLHKCKLKYNHINTICDKIERQYNENPDNKFINVVMFIKTKHWGYSELVEIHEY